MLVRHLEGNREAAGFPQREAIGEGALARYLRRSLVRMRGEQSGEQHGPVADARLRPQQVELLALQVRERRDEIEVPVHGRHAKS